MTLVEELIEILQEYEDARFREDWHGRQECSSCGGMDGYHQDACTVHTILRRNQALQRKLLERKGQNNELV